MLTLLIVLTGLMAGIYFAFSVVIMKALRKLPPLQAAQAMNKINDVIVNTAFLPIFFGSTLWYAGLIVWSFADWQRGSSALVISAAVIYIIGMFVVTAFGNVPLNNKLKECADSDSRLVACWNEYQQSWTRLNHLRTLSCMAACGVLTIAQAPV
ncbi:DUF1772 domain-containing protein [Pseudomaricurvus alcaniphilus]|uniref:anthrone oxygenase family protein n=1 Tax=Pseudomaricurvus alcaniphilus TaxID=1166482 RepID=UPI0014098B97|nr:anthrone oxygenase family protein [Pseudomaricurvus alcaniphilus]NHN36173.1 DUF1772 domain-containing protein [Pseudomaricurvus alcaniphilus]